MKALLVALVLVSGCTGEVSWQYTADCLNITSGLRLDAYKLANNVRLAQKYMEPEVLNFCREFSATPIEILPADSWEEGGMEVAGMYDIFSGVRVNRHTYNLVHELFHVLDAHQLVLNSYQHLDWETNGRESLDRKYNRAIDPELVIEP